MVVAYFFWILWSDVTKSVIANMSLVFATFFYFPSNLETQIKRSTFIHSGEVFAILFGGFQSLQAQSHVNYSLVLSTYWLV